MAQDTPCKIISCGQQMGEHPPPVVARKLQLYATTINANITNTTNTPLLFKLEMRLAHLGLLPVVSLMFRIVFFPVIMARCSPCRRCGRCYRCRE